MSELPSKITKSERELLRQLAQEAWEAEIDSELEQLFENFSRWADDGMSALELSDKIHEFHNDASRELYARYTGLDPAVTVARAIALGILQEGVLGDTLFAKLWDQIQGFRMVEDE